MCASGYQTFLGLVSARVVARGLGRYLLKSQQRPHDALSIWSLSSSCWYYLLQLPASQLRDPLHAVAPQQLVLPLVTSMMSHPQTIDPFSP